MHLAAMKSKEKECEEVRDFKDNYNGKISRENKLLLSSVKFLFLIQPDERKCFDLGMSKHSVTYLKIKFTVQNSLIYFCSSISLGGFLCVFWFLLQLDRYTWRENSNYDFSLCKPCFFVLWVFLPIYLFIKTFLIASIPIIFFFLHFDFFFMFLPLLASKGNLRIRKQEFYSLIST